MDSINNEEEQQTLVDSGTESITESPLVEDENEPTDEPADSNSKRETIKKREKLSSLLDRSFSIDENDLCTPLQPIPIEILHIAQNNNGSLDETASDISLRSDEDDGIAETEEELIYAIHNLECKNTEVSESSGESAESQNIKDSLTIVNQRKEAVTINLLTLAGKQLENGINVETKDIISEYDIPRAPTNSTSSILRKPVNYDDEERGSSSTTSIGRRVSFPTDTSILITYKEPENNFPWFIGRFVPPEEILKIYVNSCIRNKTVELDSIKAQILEIKNNTNHSAIFRLNAINFTHEVNETLEDVLKVANFHTLIIQDCIFPPQTMSEFLSIIEYYESIANFEIEMEFNEDDTWKCLCVTCSNIHILESLSFRKMAISENYMRHLVNTIRMNPSITQLRFDTCVLVKLPNFYLIEALMMNRSLRELYLPATGLYTKEAEVLQRFLVNNTHLKVLDLGNNFLGDRGLEVLAKGLCRQNIPGIGLAVLIIFNNQITEKSCPVVKNIIIECKNLHTLNIGFNNLTDAVLICISEALPFTQSLEGLGLQSTLLTCRGIAYLAEAIPNNESLRKINLKGNKGIRIPGLETLCNALTNSKITKIEIDETNSSCKNPVIYSEQVNKLQGICDINKSYIESQENEDDNSNISLMVSRKVSLNCEPNYNIPDPTFTAFNPTPTVNVPSTSQSAPNPTTSRFRIVPVPEPPTTPDKSSQASSSRASRSRFHVTRVLSSPDEDESLGRFANIRSSVSSNDSVDSLQNIHIESDSE